MLAFAMSRESVGKSRQRWRSSCLGRVLRQRYQANDIIELVSRGDMATGHPTSSSSDIAR
jgi:hypothetical protein